MNIYEFEIPDALARDLESGGRRLSCEQKARLKALLNRVEAPDPKLYRLEYLIRCYDELRNSPQAQYYLGTSSDVIVPGNIDPRRTLIIGEAEPDSPIALDYRTDEPRVIYLGDVDHISYWIELCSDYAGLIRLLDK